MKILTVLIPVYNTEKYIRRCVDTLMVDNILDDIEVLIVSDGSKDGSVDIAKEYEAKYPNTVKVIEKENGGHGSTINKGLECATGKYFRVLDSDDWFNPIDFEKFVQRLKNEEADLVVCNYCKEFVYESRSEYFEYEKLEEDKTYDFSTFDLELLKGEYFVMATSTYKTEVLRRSGLHLLEKTFYVDMQFNVVPMTEVKTFAYYDLDIYRYFIGRPDQSMNMNNFVRNQNHHKKMIKWLIEYYTKKKDSLNENQRKYIEMILIYTLNTHYAIYCEYDQNHKRAYNEIVAFDKYLLKKNPDLYNKLDAMGYIRYNRKTNFQGIKRNGKIWKKIMVVGRLLKR